MNPEQLKMFVYNLMASGQMQQPGQGAPQGQANMLDPVRQQLAQLMFQTKNQPHGIPALGQFQQNVGRGFTPQTQGQGNGGVLMPHRQQMAGSPYQKQALQMQNQRQHMMAQSQQSAGY